MSAGREHPSAWRRSPRCIRPTLIVAALTVTLFGVTSACSPERQESQTPSAAATSRRTPSQAAPSTPPAATAVVPGTAPGSTATAVAPTASPEAPPTPSGAAPVATVEPSRSGHDGVHTTIVVPGVATPRPDGGPDAGSASPDPVDGPGPSPTVGAYVPPESIDTEDKRLNVTVGGKTIYLRNGGRVELGDGLAVEIYLDPYPPTTLHGVVDFYITHHGEPVTDASVDVEFDMLAMEHGPFITAARDIGGGHHLATLDYIMFGAWDQTFTIRRGLERHRLPVVIAAYP